MIVSEDRILKAVEALRSFGAKRVLLFGSYADHPELARDVDLAAEGIAPAKLWRVDGAVSEALDVPFDLVIREVNPELYDIIRKRAKVLYEQV
jgi:predicted nucleotidyltransferase